MLDLNRTDIWKVLEAPIKEVAKLPELLKELRATENTKILSEICCYYIYCQNTIYQSTFVTIPHLVDIYKSSNNTKFKADILLDLSYVVGSMADCHFGHNVVDEGNFDESLSQELSNAFFQAFAELKVFVFDIIEEAKKITEMDKPFYITLLAAVHHLFPIADFFMCGSGHEEFESACPHCSGFFLLQNENNVLKGYIHWPIFDEKQVPFMVIPKVLPIPEKDVRSDNTTAWITYYCQTIEESLYLPILPYLFGTIACPKCNKDYEVMPSIVI